MQLNNEAHFILTHIDDPLSPIAVSHTGDARAAIEVHFLYASGKYECADITCGGERGTEDDGDRVREKRAYAVEQQSSFHSHTC